VVVVRRLFVSLSVGLLAVFAPSIASAASVSADFNGDGFADLAVGVPFEDLAGSAGTIFDAGAVSVIYGSSNGLVASRNQLWHQDRAGIPDSAEDGDGFGSALAAADFNGDGFADLAAGVPNESVDVDGVFVGMAGAVNIIFGSANGLTGTGSQFLRQGPAPGIGGQAEDGDSFGWALAAADFGKSSHADLAVGHPFEDGAFTDTGQVSILFGSASGITGTGLQGWTQNSTGIADSQESDDRLGYVVIAGNFGKSSHADVAFSAPFESVGTVNDAGAVHVIYGGTNGPTATGSQFITQSGSLGGVAIADTSEEFDFFGEALAAGNLGKTGQAELIIGVPSEVVGSVFDAGALHVFYGTSTGLTGTGNQLWTQNSTNVVDSAEEFDNFGSALATGNFGDSAEADLAVGVKGEGIGTIAGAGAVSVLYGTPTGLAATNNEIWSQNSTVGGVSIRDTSENGDALGSSLTAGNFGRGTQHDIVAGAPSEDIGTIADAGGANAIYGTSTGLAATGNQFWSQNSSLGGVNILDLSEVGDMFAQILS
jgi:hypothetical protein